MKLNVGCGRKIMEGYINVDIRPGPGVDIVADVGTIPLHSEIAEEIYAKHVIEHIDPKRWPAVLAHWRDMLAPGGRLVIECPDLRKCCENYAHDLGGARAWWKRCIYGDADDGGVHLNGFTLPELVADMHTAQMRVDVARIWHDDAPDLDERQWYNLRVEAVKESPRL